MAYVVESPSINCYSTQRVHVGIWYILRAQGGSHIPTLRPKYIPYTYIDPLGRSYHARKPFRRSKIYGARQRFDEPNRVLASEHLPSPKGLCRCMGYTWALK